MAKKRKSGPKAYKSKASKSKAPKSKAPHSPPPKPEDDAALWQAFTQSIHQLDLKRRVPDTTSDLLDEMLRHEHAKAEQSSPPTKKATRNSSPPKQAAAKSSPKSPPQPAQIESRQVRRIGNGRDSIDARIDLHGMRQQEAHSALRTFLHRSVSKGHRMVLVITGKGLARPDGDDRFGAFINEGALGRGVLRRNVPLWLSEPDLRTIVVGYTPAHIRHGGDGALYVQLRRQK